MQISPIKSAIFTGAGFAAGYGVGVAMGMGPILTGYFVAVNVFARIMQTTLPGVSHHRGEFLISKMSKSLCLAAILPVTALVFGVFSKPVAVAVFAISALNIIHYNSDEIVSLFKNLGKTIANA